jgi:carotenoid cleavage dioxygenase
METVLVGSGSVDPALVVEGVLPPDLQGTFLHIGPGHSWNDASDGPAGRLHAIELRDGTAVTYLSRHSAADASVFWHAGSVLALPESGRPLQYSRELEPQEFGDGLRLDIASHVRREASSGRRVLFGIEPGTETTLLRLGEWAPNGSLARAQSVTLERATWQHDIGLTAEHIVFIESPTEPLGGGHAVDYRWVPGAEGWIGVVRRQDPGGEEAAVRWVRVDPCLVTHVLGAYDEGGDGGGGGSGGDAEGTDVVLYVCVYPAPEKGQPIDLSAPVVGPAGIGMQTIGGGLGLLERWRITGERLQREQLDDRFIEYPRMDAACDGAMFRYGYCVETMVGLAPGEVAHAGLLRVDLARGETVAWHPGEARTASEPIFVRAVDGRSDDEGWLLCLVDDPGRAGTDLYVLDASSFGRRRPQAVVHLPEGVRLPFRAHGEWVGAELYR